MKNHYLILCNPKSGKGKALKILPLFQNFLKNKGITFESFLGNFPKNLESYSTLVIIGGDGTINFVLNHFKEIRIPIAFIKGGTGNDYATFHLGNLSLEKQFLNAIQPNSVLVDAGICNNKYFLNGVGIGFDGWVVKKNLGKRFFTGKTAYYSTILSLLLFYKESPVSISVDEEILDQTTFMLSIAKGKTYGGGFEVAPLANPNNHLFEFIGIKKIGLLNRLRYLPVIEKGKHLNLPFVNYTRGKNISILANHKLQAHLDGEHMESNEFKISLLPNYLQIKSASFQAI
jgi:diacylglycerol kinase (ATP)